MPSYRALKLKALTKMSVSAQKDMKGDRRRFRQFLSPKDMKDVEKPQKSTREKEGGIGACAANSSFFAFPFGNELR